MDRSGAFSGSGVAALVAKLCFALGLSVFTATSLADRTAQVVVYSHASEAYLADKKSGKRPEVERYIVMPGQFVGGAKSDRSLTRITFENVRDVLRGELEKQRYLPAMDRESAKLLLVVHWGATDAYTSFEDLTMANQGSDAPPGLPLAASAGNPGMGRDPDAISRQNNPFRTSGDFGIDRFSDILGIHPSQVDDEEEQSRLIYELSLSRYFIAVVAYDIPTLVETGEKQWLWSTRFSVKSAGANFDDAHYALARAASDYFGKNLKNVEFPTTHFGRGEAKLGKLEVLGEEKAPKKKPKR